MKIISAIYMLYIAAMLASALSRIDMAFFHKMIILLVVAGIFQAGWIMGQKNDK